MQLTKLANYRARTSRPLTNPQELPTTPPHVVAPAAEVEVVALKEAEEAWVLVVRQARQRITDRTESLNFPLLVPWVETVKKLDLIRVLPSLTAAFRQRTLVRGSSFLARSFIMILLTLQTAESVLL